MKISNSLRTRLKAKYGPWAVVTGASSGIGKELAQRSAEAGLNVILVARSEMRLEILAKELRSRHGVQAEVVVADLSNSGGTEKVVAAVTDYDVGLLIASAGFGTSGELIHGGLKEELEMIDVNCKSLFALTHHFARSFVDRGRGGIVLLSSMVALQGAPYTAHYAATKAYVQSLAEGLHVELKSRNVDVLSAAPGPVDTGFEQRANMRMGNAQDVEQMGIPILKALGKRATVFPGLLTKVLVYSLRMLPRWGRVRVMQLVMSGMTKHQRES